MFGGKKINFPSFIIFSLKCMCNQWQEHLIKRQVQKHPLPNGIFYPSEFIFHSPNLNFSGYIFFVFNFVM